MYWKHICYRQTLCEKMLYVSSYINRLWTGLGSQNFVLISINTPFAGQLTYVDSTPTAIRLRLVNVLPQAIQVLLSIESAQRQYKVCA